MLTGVCSRVLASTLLPRAVLPSVVTAGQLQFHSGVGYDRNYLVHKKFGKKRKQKHWINLYRKERADKMMKIELIDFHEKTDDLTPQEIRMKMKQRGLLPMRPWVERPVHVACTPATFEAYIPPEGDGKISFTSKEGAKQKMELMGNKGKNYMSLRKVYRYEEDFDLKVFAQEAQQIYIKTHDALAAEDTDLLHSLVTERAFPIVTHETARKTIRWQFLETIEPARAVQARVHEMVTSDNLFAQITVRLHTKQTLAVYDRFGRLMHGSEVVAKDVLEYVVFEKHIVNSYGVWRVHDKIIPTWASPRPSGVRTFRQPAEKTEGGEQQQQQTDAESPPSAENSSSPSPAVA